MSSDRRLQQKLMASNGLPQEAKPLLNTDTSRILNSFFTSHFHLETLKRKETHSYRFANQTYSRCVCVCLCECKQW